MEISRAAGTGAGDESTDVADSLVAVDSLSFISGMAESVKDFMDCLSVSGASSSRSGSVGSGAFSEDVEDTPRVLLARRTPSSPTPATGLLDSEEAERSSGSS